MARRRYGRGRRRRSSKYDPIKGYRSRRRYYKKVLKSRDITIVNNSRPGLNLPINPRYLTKFTLSFSGYTNSALNRNNGYFAIKLNSPHLPLETGGYADFTASENNAGLIIGRSGIAGALTLAPRGWSNLASANMYHRYRVYASKIKVTILPSNQSDSSVVTVIPITNTDTVGPETAAGLSQNIAYSKEKVVTIGADNKSNTVHNYIDIQSLFGINKNQVMANEDLSSPYDTDPDALAVWLIKYSKMQSFNYTGPLGFNIEVTYYTELYEMNYESMSIEQTITDPTE